ncbi:MAG: hypothetical protein N2234_06085 [Planctomycetota bacterium]|nr:hypothetical protein [Planctomycetota bacterium]
MRKVILWMVVILCGFLLSPLFSDGEKWEKVSKDFRDVMKNPRAGVKEIIEVVQRMAALNDRRAVGELIKETLFHKEFEVRKATFSGLAKTSDEKAIEVIVRSCATENEEDRKYILLRLVSRFKTKGAMEVLLKAAESGDWRHRLIAAEKLVDFKDELLAKNRLKSLSEDKNLLVRYYGLKGMAIVDEKSKMPDEFKRGTEFVEGRFLPEVIYSDTLAVFVDFSNDMDVEMALPEREIIKRLKEMEKEKEKKEKPEPPKKKDGKEQPAADEIEKEKEKEYRRNFVVSRLKYAKQEVLDFLERLPKGVKVKLYRVSSSLRGYSDKAVEVTKNELEGMKKFLDSGVPGPARNWELALRAAFEDAAVDTVLLVGCGSADGSRYDDYEEFLKWFEERSWARGIRLHIWGIRADYEAGFGDDIEILKWNKKNEAEVGFLRRLAQLGGGGCGILDHRGKVPIPEIPKEEPKKEEPKKEEPKKEEGKKDSK